MREKNWDTLEMKYIVAEIKTSGWIAKLTELKSNLKAQVSNWEIPLDHMQLDRDVTCMK